MLEWRWPVRVAATLGLALVTFASAPTWTQSRRDGRSLPTVMVEGHEAVEGEVIVRYRSEAGIAGRQRAEFDVESEETEPIGRRGERRLRSRRLGTRAMLQRLRDNPDVEFVEPNYIIRLTATPNEPWFVNLWGLFNSGQVIGAVPGIAGADIDAPGAWQFTTGSRASVVAVIDTGIDYTHPDLAANIWTAPRAFTVTIGGVTITCAAGTHGFNAITNTCNPMDDHSHGTHVAGTIGAVGNNGVGVAGVNWVTSMMGLKFLGASGSGSTSDAIEAIEFAIQAKAALGADANVRILNNSWGGGGYSAALANQIAAANNADMLFVAAAGNTATNIDLSPFYPASYTHANVVSVASSTNRDQRSSFSNYGAVSVHLAAPGTSILSTVPGNGYAYYSGTSMASPHVAGAAALMLATCPLTTESLKATLLSSVDLPGALAGLTATGGRLDVHRAIQQCIDLDPPEIVVNSPAVVPGGTIDFQVLNGPGNIYDWVALHSTSAGDGTYLQWKFLSGSQTLPASGLTTATLQFTAPQTPGTYNIRLFVNGGYGKRATSSVITVVSPPRLTINDVSVTEGNSGTTHATFTVTASPVNPLQTVTVNYATANGSATGNTDYSAASGSLTFAPGVSTQTITVSVVGENVLEPNETFFVNLSNPINGVIDDAQGLGTILTDDAPPPPSISLLGNTVAPGGTITLTVLNGPGNAYDWVAFHGAAAGDTSYLQWKFLSGTQTPPPSGLTTATVQFTAPQTTGTYNIRLFTNGTYTKVAASPTITVTTQTTPQLSINDVSVTEGNSGTANATFTVTLSPVNASQSVTVHYATADGSATTANNDYSAASGTLTFAPGVSTQTLTVPVTGDTTGESTETFFVNLSNATDATISDGQGVGTIVTDDTSPPPAGPAITLQSAWVAAGGTITLTVENGPGNIYDWVALHVAAASDSTYLQWKFLSGTQTLPPSGLTTATLQFTAPQTPGTYNIRLFANGGYTKLATSAAITVALTP